MVLHHRCGDLLIALGISSEYRHCMSCQTPVYECLDDPVCVGIIVQWPNGSLCEYVFSGYERMNAQGSLVGLNLRTRETNLTVHILSASSVL